MNDYENAIDKRCSRRKYLPIALEPSVRDALQAAVKGLNTKGSIKIIFVLDNGEAFNGFRKSYGMFSGVKNYFTLIGSKSDLLTAEKLGYYGEELVLHATMMGLGTCWVGGTFDRASCPVKLLDGESVICAITVGVAPPKLSVKEKFIHGMTHRKSKTIEQMTVTDGVVPDWFIKGMRAVQKAPSAVNRQPVTISCKGGIVTASVKDTADASYALDLGIAKLHFMRGVGSGSWEFGNGGKFRYE